MKVRNVKCGHCDKDIIAGQLINWLSWKSLGGGGGDFVNDNRMIVHRICLRAAKEKAWQDEHPYGDDGVDLGKI